MEKTEFDTDLNYHNYESNFEEDQKIPIVDESPDILIKEIRNVSDDEYRKLCNNSTPDFKRKHLIDIDSTPPEVDSERKIRVSQLVEEFQKKWSESFDNLGFLRYAICVSLNFKKIMVHSLMLFTIAFKIW